MSGIDPFTDEPIYYPGERRSKADKFWNGSSIHGGGFNEFLGTFLMIIGGALLLWGVLSDTENKEPIEPTKTEQTER